MTARHTLAGGTVLLLEESHSIPLVSIVVSLRTGSAMDPPGREGLARATLRMLRRGCDGLKATEIEEHIDTLGSEMAVDTAPSTVAVHAQVIARNLDRFADLLARLLATPTFPQDELERLKRESAAEIVEARDNDRVVAQKAFQRTLFRGHPYGRNPGGTVASMTALEGKDVRGYYGRELTKGNIVLGFAGDITEAHALEIAERIVRGVPDGAGAADTVPEPVMAPGRRLLFVDKPERTQTQILIGRLGTWPRDDDHVPASVANAIFGGTFTSRLMKEVRSNRGWSYGAYSRLGIDRRRQSFSMWTFPSAEDAASCLALEIELLEKLIAGGVTEEETSFIKQYLVRSHAFDIDTANKRLHQALDVELLDLPADYYSGYTSRVSAVTAAQANAAVKARLSPADLLVTVVGTADDILEKVRAAIPGIAATEVVSYEED